MAYEKTTWKSGDVVTSAKLNNMENGIANAGSIMIITETMEGQTGTLNKTWNEIHAAIESGSICVIMTPLEDGIDSSFVTSVFQDGAFFVSSAAVSANWEAESADGYPSYNHD